MAFNNFYLVPPVTMTRVGIGAMNREPIRVSPILSNAENRDLRTAAEEVQRLTNYPYRPDLSRPIEENSAYAEAQPTYSNRAANANTAVEEENLLENSMDYFPHLTHNLEGEILHQQLTAKAGGEKE